MKKLNEDYSQISFKRDTILFEMNDNVVKNWEVNTILYSSASLNYF